MTLLSHWSHFDIDHKPCVLEADKVAWSGLQANNSLDLGLLPQPFMGDLENAEIYILMLNPGIGKNDRRDEKDTEYRSAVQSTFRQEWGSDESRFPFLDPKFKSHGGYQYWNRKFKGVIQCLAANRGCDDTKARDELASKLALIQLFPYRSVRFNAGRLLDKLLSVSFAKEFVEVRVIDRVRNGNAVAIVVRGLKHWEPSLSSNLCAKDGLVRYDPKRQARFAHLTPKTNGGQRILEHLGVKCEQI